MAPEIGLDYFYITREGVRRRDEMAKELVGEGEDAITQARANGEVLKCMLVRCMQTKNVSSHVVPQKGDDEDHYCAKLAVADIEWLGHTRIRIKTENERAIVALKHRVAKILKEWKSRGNVQVESPAAYESQSNGGIGGRHQDRTWIAPCAGAVPGVAPRQVRFHWPRSYPVVVAAYMHPAECQEPRPRWPDMLGAH